MTAINDARLSPFGRISTDVRINGTLVTPSAPLSADGVPGVGSIRISRSFDAPIPRCEVGVNRVSSMFQRGDGLNVGIGFDGLLARRFTGTVISRNRGVSRGTVTGVGQLYRALRGVEGPEVNVTGMSLSAAIADRFDFVGITSYSIDASLDYELGEVVEAILPAGPVTNQLAALLDIRDAEMIELSTGQIVVRPVDFAPAPTTFKNYVAGANVFARIIDGSDREDPDWFYDRVIVEGASVPLDGGDPEDPDTVFEPITTTVVRIGSSLQQPPLPDDAYTTMRLQAPLIDDLTELVAYATRKLNKHGTVPRIVTIEMLGDPELELGMTLGFDFADIDMEGRWFLQALEDDFDNAPESEGLEAPGYRSFLTLRGGDTAGGSVAVYPIALFTYQAILQTIGEIAHAIVTFVSTSFDPDGVIVSTDWEIDGESYSGTIVTVAVPVDDRVEFPAAVTVTDGDGLTATRSEMVALEANNTTTVQAGIGAALGEHAAATPDSGLTWQDSALAGCVVVMARPYDGENFGHFVYGADDGSLWLTTDAAATIEEVLTGVGASWAWAQWDWRNPIVAWALTEDFRLYTSITGGTTFGLYAGGNIRSAMSLPNAIGGQIGLPAAGGVWLYGGTGTGHALIVYDPTLIGAFTQLTLGGELAADSPGASDLHIVDAADMGFGLCVILNTPTSAGVCIYFTHGTDPANWRRATGLDPGLTDGRVMLPGSPYAGAVFHAMFADRDVWHIDANSGTPVCTKEPDVLPEGFVPNHGIFESDIFTGVPSLSGVYLIAAEDEDGTGAIFKSVDDLITVELFHPIIAGWNAGDKAKFLAMGGAGAPVTVEGGALHAMSEDGILASFNGVDAWGPVGTPEIDMASGEKQRLGVLSGGGFVVINNRGGDAESAVSDGLWYSATGDVWENKIPARPDDDFAGGPVDWDISPNGHLWCGDGRSFSGLDDDTQDIIPARIHRSTDRGPTWEMMHEDAGFDITSPITVTNAHTPIRGFACDSEDSSRVFAFAHINGTGAVRSIFTLDGGGSFSRRVTDDNLPNSALSNDDLRSDPNGRFLYAPEGANDFAATDDDGVEWSNIAGIATVDFVRQIGWRRHDWFQRMVVLYVKQADPSDTATIGISEDGGVNWSDGVSIPGVTGVASIEYDAPTDTAYVAFENDDAHANDMSVYRVAGLFSGSPVVTDITFNLPTVFGDDDAFVGYRCLALAR